MSKPFIVYKASAGSGKTYTLVLEYLKIILDDPFKVKSLLAITFTNAAAAEMKERIIKTLGSIAALSEKKPDRFSKEENQIIQQLKESLSLSSSEIIRRAQLCLTRILHNYGDFSISTIDSFVHRVIRSFAFDLQLPLNFDIELDQNHLLKQAIDLMISRVGKDTKLTELLVKYVESRTEDEKSYYIEYDIANIAQNLMDEKGSLYVDKLKKLQLEDFSDLNQSLTQKTQAFNKQIALWATEALNIIQNNQIDINTFYRGKNGIGSYFTSLAEGRIEDKIRPNSYVKTTVIEDKWCATKAKADEKAAIELVKSSLLEYYQRIQTLADQKLDDHKLLTLVKNNLFPLALLNELDKVMQEFKEEKALLHISDFNKKISEIIAVEPAPFIYERIGERYQHYMIDEFQDTSALQWQNLLPLIDNSLASGHINLLVGDGKQAIYRWRNGDVEQFANLPHLTNDIKAESKPLWETQLIRNYNPKNLDTNYRSFSNVIDFNNRFFNFSKNYLTDGLKKIYDLQEQKTTDKKTGGYVELQFIGSEEAQEHDYEENTLQQTLQTIRQLENRKHPLSDITILCRTNQKASRIASFLLENNLNVISSESLLLNQSDGVNFIIALLKALRDLNDEITQLEIIRFLVKNKTIPLSLHEAFTLYRNFQPQTENASSLLKLQEFIHNYGIAISFDNLKNSNLYELGEELIRIFFQTHHKPNPFLAFFLDVLYEYQQKYHATIHDFLEWWNDNAHKQSVVIPKGADAVQVMTIHKSKGLQFPVVICPFMDKSLGRLAQDGMWIDLDHPDTQPLPAAYIRISKKGLENTPLQHLYDEEKARTLLDNLNVLYVAFTRAVQKLFVFSKYPKSGKFSDNDISGIIRAFAEQEQPEITEENLFSFGAYLNQEQENADENTNEKPQKTSKQSQKNGQYSFDFDEEEENQHEQQKHASSPTTLTKWISDKWSAKAAIRSRHKDRLSIPEEETERGNLLHLIMENIDSHSDIEPVLSRNLHTGAINEEEKNEWQDKIQKILQNPHITVFFSPQYKAFKEAGIYDKKGRFFRPDRLFVKDKQAIIMDYKTGKIYPKHKTQILNYQNILADMGYHQTRSFILYLDEGEVLEVK